MRRSPCCNMVGLKSGLWTPEEDRKLMSYIQQHGHGSWRALPPKAGLQRCGKSCRLRWNNYLRPDIKRGTFSLQEEQTIIQLHALLGNRWSVIASNLPKRTDNEIKNYWNTHIKKKLCKMGIDPVTHKLKKHALIGCGQPKVVANLSHMAQWESARLEAEARIVRESKLQSISYNSRTAAAAAPPPPQSISYNSKTLPLPRPPCLDVLKAWQATKSGKETLTLETPTLMFNFSDNNMLVGVVNPSIHENSLTRMDYIGNPSSAACKKREEDDQGRGIIGNSLQVHDNVVDAILTTVSPNDASLLTRLPIFLEGFADLQEEPSSVASTASASAEGGNVDVYEDNKTSYWSHILTVANSCMDAFVF